MAQHTLLSAHNLSKTFGSKRVLQDINFDIKQGETFVIIGGSGSGKSVLLKSILGLITPDSGGITIDGTDITTLKGQKQEKLMQRFGMLFQNSALFDSMTIWENIAFEHLENGMNRKEARKIAIEKLALVDLEERVADLAPSELSGGMRKRAALARAICNTPDIILYDEPTTGLDPITTDVINNLILKLQADLGLTSIVITHNMPSAYKIADRMAMLKNGEFLQVGTPKDIQNSPNPHVQQFIQGLAELPTAQVSQTQAPKSAQKLNKSSKKFAK